MTHQETLWKHKKIMVISLMSKSGKIHLYVKKYIGRFGLVRGQAKNGMLLIRFKGHTRSIPAGCVVEIKGD